MLLEHIHQNQNLDSLDKYTIFKYVDHQSLLPFLIFGLIGCCWVRLRRSSSAIGVGRYSGTVSAAFVVVVNGWVWCWCNCVAIVLIACVSFSDISVLFAVDCGVEDNALVKAVKLCNSVLCKIDVISTDGVGFVVVELTVAAVDNWLISLLSVSFASIINYKNFYPIEDL